MAPLALTICRDEKNAQYGGKQTSQIVGY